MRCEMGTGRFSLIYALLQAWSAAGVAALAAAHSDHSHLEEGHQHSMLLTSSGKQLMRHEKNVNAREDDTQLDQSMRLLAIARHGLIDVGEASENGRELQRSLQENHWHEVAAGNAQALTIHDGMIYVVAWEPEHSALHMIEKGIFAQPLHRMTPYTNWTLLGWGNMKSIAIHSSKQYNENIIYGVGARDGWLYRQGLANMSGQNTWSLTNMFQLSSISISGDTIYGVSPDHLNQIYSMPCEVFDSKGSLNLGWRAITTGPAKTIAVAGGFVFATFRNDMVYRKPLTADNRELLRTGGDANHSSGGDANHSSTSLTDSWTLKNSGKMLSVYAYGNLLYGVAPDHKVYRTPVDYHLTWTKRAKEGDMGNSWIQIAINEAGDTIYALDDTGVVHKQDLVSMNTGSDWERASEPYVEGIAIQGKVIYGISLHKTVVSQNLQDMTQSTPWIETAKCCAKAIAASDGIIYTIGTDDKLYSQSDILMDMKHNWVKAANGPMTSVTTRGDTIYSINAEGITSSCRLSGMSVYSPWVPTDFETKDPSYPAKNYKSILYHNDLMYAVGKDGQIYSKLMESPITYPPGLKAHGTTREQAYFWNLTDLWQNHTVHLREVEDEAEDVKPGTTPLYRRTTTLGPLGNRTMLDVTTSSSSHMQVAQDVDVSPLYVDTFRDVNANATFQSEDDSILGFDIENDSIFGAHASGVLPFLTCVLAMVSSAQFD